MSKNCVPACKLPRDTVRACAVALLAFCGRRQGTTAATATPPPAANFTGQENLAHHSPLPLLLPLHALNLFTLILRVLFLDDNARSVENGKESQRRISSHYFRNKTPGSSVLGFPLLVAYLDTQKFDIGQQHLLTPELMIMHTCLHQIGLP